MTHDDTTTSATVRLRPRAPRAFLRGLVAIFAFLATAVYASVPAAAQEAASPSPGATVKQIASDLYFFYDYSGSNSVFLVTDDGVLVADLKFSRRGACRRTSQMVLRLFLQSKSVSQL
jgi:hypothetical protein